MARLAVLHRLAAFSEAPAETPRWWHWIVGLDATGRLRLPVEARPVASGARLVRASSSGDVVVLRREGFGAGLVYLGAALALIVTWVRATELVSSDLPAGDVHRC